MKRSTTVAAVMTVGVALFGLRVWGCRRDGEHDPRSDSDQRGICDRRAGWRGGQEKETKAQKLAKALKACKKMKPKHKRKSCETHAKKLYGSKHTKKGTETEKSHGTETKPSETPTQELARAKTASTSPPASSVTAGKSLFTSNCEGCHGPTGEGTNTGPNLHLMPRAQSVAGVIEQLVQPEGAMPSFDSSLTFAEKEEAADYVAVDITHVATESHWRSATTSRREDPRGS